MKTIKRTLLICSIFLISCKGQTPASIENQQNKTMETHSIVQPEQMKIKSLSGYFFKNTHSVDENFVFFIFKNQESFNDYLGMARTMNNKIDKPDFVNNTVLAIVCKPTQVNTEILVTKAEKINGDSINIYFDVKTSESLSYTVQPIVVFSLEKDESLKTLNFIWNEKIIKTLSVSK